MASLERPILFRFITLAILGGTGNEGKGLAYRWGRAGYRVLIGSRTDGKARAAAAEVMENLGGQGLVEGRTNLEAAEAGDIVILTIPYQAQRELLTSVEPALEGKILVNVVVPLAPPKVTRVQMPPAGSSSQEAQELLGPDVDVVTAFQNVSHDLLFSDEPIECDVLVCGRDKKARQEVLKLVEAAGMVGYDAGALENAVVVEGLTSILIHINKQYGVPNSGIRITGVPVPPAE
ncbi:MAG TPA: NADPH-dependent F420 reductase [Anaerolineales bacterium]|nr:NADPH-dependent F420 reductase [Anaerolineales bacterium]